MVLRLLRVRQLSPGVAPSINEDGTPLTDLAGYKIYYGTASGNYTNNVDAGNVTSYAFHET